MVDRPGSASSTRRRCRSDRVFPSSAANPVWQGSGDAGRFAGGEAFNDAQLEPVVLLDVQTSSLDVPQRSAPEVIISQVPSTAHLISRLCAV
ncbi:hypothetical protein ABZ214_01210 [Streptomyces iakyrus]|uniref:hypothetical protein n=1 Tax=Streptomyces iakyrus TaxID=68219 RepID=UPI0033BE36FE